MQKPLVKWIGLSLLLVPVCQTHAESPIDSTTINPPPSAINSPDTSKQDTSKNGKPESAVAPKETGQSPTLPKDAEKPTNQRVVPKEAWQPPTQPKDAEKPKDPKNMNVQSFLGADVYQILSSPERVESFRVFPEPASKEMPENKQLAGFPIEKVGPTLTNDQIKTFQTLVLSDRSYLFEVEKRCFFHPDTGLRFTKGQKTVEILLSYSCELWQFSFQGDTKTEDFDPVKTELLDFRKSLFSPNH